jgi:hypothetical protein
VKATLHKLISVSNTFLPEGRLRLRRECNVQKYIAVAIAILTSLLGFNGVGQAQSAAELRGSIAAVDCQSGVFTLDSAGNAETIYASNTTGVEVGYSTAPFCTLEGYVGAPAAVWVVPYGSQFLATQIDVTGPTAFVPVTQAIAPMPLIGSVLGTVLVAGLLYLLVDDGGVYYRYPYYGGYYHHYWNARYRPYRGWYPASAPIVSVADPLSGTVLGVVTVNNYQYLAVRERNGQIRRYPDYGPYRSYYHQTTARPYRGAYAGAAARAAVAQGDPHWDAPRDTMQRISRTIKTSPSRPSPWSAPHRQAAPARSPKAQPRPQVRPQTRPAQQRPQPAVQHSQPRPQSRPAQQRPQPAVQHSQPRPQSHPAQQRPQPAVQHSQPRPQSHPAQQRPQPAVQRPQPQTRPVQQRPQPAVQRPQPQAQPPRNNGGGGGGRAKSQCNNNSQSNQSCNNSPGR